MGDFDLGGLGSLISAGVGLYDFATGTSRNRSKEDAQELMALQQQYNLQNMAIEQQYAKDLFDYQGPQHQMDLAQRAGLNPLLVANGNMNLQGQSSARSQGIDAAAAAQAAETRRANDLAQMFQVAQIANLNSQTLLNRKNADKVGEETKGLSIDNLYKDGLYQLDVKYKGTIIEGQIEENKLTIAKQKNIDKQTSKLAVEMDEINQNIKESMARIGKIESETEYQKVLSQWYPREARARIQDLCARARLSKSQAKQYEDLLPLLITKQIIENGLLAFDFQEKNVLADYTDGFNLLGQLKVGEAASLGSKYDLETEENLFDLGYLRSYGDYERFLYLLRQTLRSAFPFFQEAEKRTRHSR